MKKNILLFGSTGQIGSVILEKLLNKYKIIAPQHLKVDLNNRTQVEKFIKKHNINYIIHAAGFTSIDKAPENPHLAFMTNAGCLYFLTNVAREKKIPVMYVSTDIVFNGLNEDRPYTEDDIPDPLSLNAKFKRTGELITLQSSPQNCVIRLDVCFSSYFPKRLDIARMTVRNLRKNEVFQAPADQKINPIFVDDLVNAIEVLISKKASGIYHVGTLDNTSPYEFAKKVAKEMGLNEKLIKKTTFKKFSKARPEPRPKNEWLNPSKFIKEFGKGILHTIDESIKVFAKNYKQ